MFLKSTNLSCNTHRQSDGFLLLLRHSPLGNGDLKGLILNTMDPASMKCINTINKFNKGYLCPF